jgi:transporter family-2 protein
MPVLLFSALVALVAGVAVGFQNPLAALMGQRIGLLQGAFVVHLGGAVVAGGLMAVTPGGRIAGWNTVPWYALGAGALGVVFISAISYTIPRIGVAATVGLLLTAQLAIAASLDHYGWLGVMVRAIDPWRMLGLALLLLGAWLVLR